MFKKFEGNKTYSVLSPIMCALYSSLIVKHISYTLKYLISKAMIEIIHVMEHILHHSQIFTIISANDDIQFIREQLKKHGFHNVEILIANHIANDIGGAQLKPLHAFDILYNKMRNDNLILQQMRWLIHVDDDTTNNLAALAFQLQQYNDQNHDPILLSHLFDSHIPNGVPVTLMAFSQVAFRKVALYLIENKMAWMYLDKTSPSAVHLFDVFGYIGKENRGTFNSFKWHRKASSVVTIQ